MRARRWISAAAVALSLLGAACGSEVDGEGGVEAKKENETKVEAKQPLDVVLASSDRTREAKSSKVFFTTTINAEGETLTFTGDGAFDFVDPKGTLVMDMGTIQGMEFGKIEAVMIGTVMYQKYPPQMAAMLGGKPWVKIDMAAASAEAGIDLESLNQSSQGSNASQMLGMSEGAENVTEVGREQVRGVDTTHYKATVNFRKAAEASTDPAAKKSLEAMIQQYGVETMPVDVWIDDDGLTRKNAFTIDMSKVTRPGKPQVNGTMDIAMEFFDFGTTVNAVAPPADQVTDLLELLAQQKRKGR